jgi:two-component system nitrogen regulation sensor histidine kinase NtrY
MMKFLKKLEIEWRIIILAAIVLLAFAFPLQKFYMSRLKATLEESVDPNLERLYKSIMKEKNDSLTGIAVSSLERNRQWKVFIPIIIEEQYTAMVLLSVVLSFSLLLLAFWSLKRLTKPLRDLASAAEKIGKGQFTVIENQSGGALGMLEESMSSMQDELIKLRERARTQGMETAWREIARVMAHEIKNPLTPMQLTIDRLHEKLEQGTVIENQDMIKFLNRMESQVLNLERLVNDFRSFSREPEPQMCDVSLRSEIDNISSDQGFTLKTGIEGDANVKADPNLLRRVFLNIWKNSFEAGATEIEVNIIQSEQKVILTIRDNGCGITAEHIEKVWIPYVTFKKGGTGLGLPVVKRMLEVMGATVSLQSSTDQINHGVTITINFQDNNCSEIRTGQS